jgi:eukaryotic-like serine/threonine-protein kinase
LYSGRLGKARDLSRRAIASAESAQNKESAALWSADAAVREALVGNHPAALERANAALSLAMERRNAESEATLALALSGDGARAQSFAEDLNKRFNVNTVTQSVWLPTIRAQLQINHNAPSSAVELLQAAAPYELARRQGTAAVVEFQKILNHRGLVQNCPTGALAHLNLARAYMLQGDTAKAKTAYNDFLTLWKDADADIPVLTAAKAEYAKLQ